LLTRQELCERVFAALGFVTMPANFVSWAEQERDWQSLVRDAEVEGWSHRGDELLVENFSQAYVESQVARAYESTLSWRFTAPFRRMAERRRSRSTHRG
jgi:hypothetical protein